MLRALTTAATGMIAQQNNLDVISNSIANLSTCGYKKVRAEFQDIPSKVHRTPGAQMGQGTYQPVDIEVGLGVKTAAATRIFSAGNLESTDKQLDMAIAGDGFFQITLDDGSVTYNGSSATTSDRKVTIAEGTTFSYNTTGDSVFGTITLYSTTTNEDGTTTTTSAEADFFSEMSDLYNLVEADTLDYDAIREKLEVLSAVQEDVINQMDTVSAGVSKPDSTLSVNESTITSLTETKAEIKEVDITAPQPN